MPRFFIDSRLTSVQGLDLESSDLTNLIAIREDGPEFELEKTLFDFSIDIVDPHRANNRIHKRFIRKTRVGGFIENILRPGRNCREVDEEEYKAFYAVLLAKSEHMKRKRRRKLVVTEERESTHHRLP